MTEILSELTCPRHGRRLVVLYELNAQRVWEPNGLLWCKTCRAGFLEEWARNPSANVVATIRTDPGPAGCPRCVAEGQPCVACQVKVCWGHTAWTAASQGGLQRICRTCWVLLAPRDAPTPMRPPTRMAPA
jgi:hypothetical protein